MQPRRDAIGRRPDLPITQRWSLRISPSPSCPVGDFKAAGGKLRQFEPIPVLHWGFNDDVDRRAEGGCGIRQDRLCHSHRNSTQPNVAGPSRCLGTRLYQIQKSEISGSLPGGVA
jgi:hypothetical protein